MRRRGPRPRDPHDPPPTNFGSRKIAGVPLLEILDLGREMQRPDILHQRNIARGQERAAAPCPRADVLVFRNASVNGQASAAATGL